MVQQQRTAGHLAKKNKKKLTTENQFVREKKKLKWFFSSDKLISAKNMFSFI